MQTYLDVAFRGHHKLCLGLKHIYLKEYIINQDNLHNKYQVTFDQLAK
jgi:hypothetical protein